MASTTGCLCLRSTCGCLLHGADIRHRGLVPGASISRFAHGQGARVHSGERTPGIFAGFRRFSLQTDLQRGPGILASLTGVVFAVENRFVMTSVLAVDKTLEALFMTIIGGWGHFLGPLVGAAVYHFAGDWLSSLAKIHPYSNDGRSSSVVSTS